MIWGGIAKLLILLNWCNLAMAPLNFQCHPQQFSHPISDNNTVNKHPHPIEAHFLERLWCYMFSENKFLTKAFFDVIKTKIERNLLNN